MVKHVLDEKSVAVMKHLYKREFVSLTTLSNLMGVSTRSVRNYIKMANQELKTLAEILNKRGKGFYLVVYDQEAFDELWKEVQTYQNPDSDENRLASIIEFMITSDDQPTIDEIAYTLNLGRTTLVNELSKANSLLSSYRIKIEGKPNQGVNLVGSELDLRFFILDNAFEWIYGEYPLDQDIIDMIHSLSVMHDFESVTENRMIQYTIIVLDRILHGHSISEVEQKFHSLLSTPDYQIAKEFAEGIEARLPINVPKEEIIFLTIPISGRRTPTNDRSLTQVEIPKSIDDIVAKIVNEIGFNQEVVEKNPKFFRDLKLHLTFLLNRLTFNIKLKNPLLPDVKNKYPVAFHMAKVAGDVIRESFDFNVSEHELGYLAFYFEIFKSQSKTDVINIKKAAVVCGTGRGTAKLLSIQLQQVFNVEVAFDLYSETDITEQILNQYDIVFSTIRLSYDLKVPLLTISEIFNHDAVQKEIEQIKYIHRYGLNQQVNDHYVLSSLINEDKFFQLNCELSYFDNLENMVEELLDKEYLDEAFLDRLKKRISKGSMIFSNFVAFPHTFNEKSNKVELSIGVCQHSLSSEQVPVKLIFLLGIPSEENSEIENLLVKLYDEIISISNQPEIIEQLVMSENVVDFNNTLRKFK